MDLLLHLFMRASDPDIVLLLFVAMAPPLGLEPFQQIVNVHWAGGLAVEFEPDAT